MLFYKRILVETEPYDLPQRKGEGGKENEACKSHDKKNTQKNVHYQPDFRHI